MGESSLLVVLKWKPLDVVLVKPKGKIDKNTYRSSKFLYQWKFQIDFRNFLLENPIFLFDEMN